MARVLVTICDRHDEDEQVPADTTLKFTINGREIEVDLCSVCAGPYETMLDELKNIGRRIGVDQRVRASKATPPKTVPMLRDDQTLPDGSLPCGYCDRTFTGPKARLGRGTHRSAAHGIGSKGQPSTPRPRNYKCVHCPMAYHSPGRLVNHYTSAHPDTAEAQPDAPHPSLRSQNGRTPTKV